MKVEPAFWDDSDVQRLSAEQQAEIRARYDGAAEPGTPPSAADISVALVARDEHGTAVGSGALCSLGAGVAEVKRMYVVPAARGLGVARTVLAGLEDAAHERGWTTLRLETGPTTRDQGGAGRISAGAARSYGLDPRIRISLRSGR